MSSRMRPRPPRGGPICDAKDIDPEMQSGRFKLPKSSAGRRETVCEIRRFVSVARRIDVSSTSEGVGPTLAERRRIVDGTWPLRPM